MTRFGIPAAARFPRHTIREIRAIRGQKILVRPRMTRTGMDEKVGLIH
jgi:hypothetical protein